MKGRKRAKTYVCVICGKITKSSTKAKCCGKTMISRDKGSWNLQYNIYICSYQDYVKIVVAKKQYIL